MLLWLKHWSFWERRVPCVAFIHFRPNRLAFFDSDGRQPWEFVFFIPKCLQIFHNSYQGQAFGTQVCGHFCIFILDHRAHNYSLHSKYKKFTTLPYARQLQLLLHLFTNSSKELTRNEWLTGKEMKDSMLFAGWRTWERGWFMIILKAISAHIQRSAGFSFQLRKCSYSLFEWTYCGAII